MKNKIKKLISKSLKKLDIKIKKKNIHLEMPENTEHWDFACNVAMQLTKKLKQNPRLIAESIIKNIKKLDKNNILEGIEIAGPWFINFKLSKEIYKNSLEKLLKKWNNIWKNNTLQWKVYIAEHTDPNLFKEIHIGHVMTNTIWESFYRLAKFSGAKTYNVTFQWDVWLHIAKALWWLNNTWEELPLNKTPYEKQQFLGKCYVYWEENYSENKEVKAEIIEINKKVYSREDSEQNKIYDLGCKWSLEYLDTMYEMLGSKFDHYFLESATFTDWLKIVKENLGKNWNKVFIEWDKWAIIFKGSDYKLHDRVFINSEWLPTYEAKDIWLFFKKWQKYNPDYSLTITWWDQKEYFKVVQEAAWLIKPEWKEKTLHRAHWLLKLKTWKMWSRTWNIIRAQDWIDGAKENILNNMKLRDNLDLDTKELEETALKIAISAIKYSILKVSAWKDIIYDESVALDFSWNTWPYLQYSYVRVISILNKLDLTKLDLTKLSEKKSNISWFEKKLHNFEDNIKLSLENLSSHNLANYLYDLASEFSSFYARTKILDKTNPDYRYNLSLILVFANIMKNWLYCLGINTVEKM